MDTNNLNQTNWDALDSAYTQAYQHPDMPVNALRGRLIEQVVAEYPTRSLPSRAHAEHYAEDNMPGLLLTRDGVQYRVIHAYVHSYAQRARGHVIAVAVEEL